MSIEDDTPDVEYRTVIGFPLYRVGSDGTIWTRIRRTGRTTQVTEDWRRRKPGLTTRGYPHVILVEHLGGKPFGRTVHRLILEAFVGPCPAGMECCHNNGIAVDNRLVNLRWDTHQANIDDRERCGNTFRGSQMSFAKLREDDIPVIRRLLAEGLKYTTIARRFGVDRKTIKDVESRKTWFHVR